MIRTAFKHIIFLVHMEDLLIQFVSFVEFFVLVAIAGFCGLID